MTKSWPEMEELLRNWRKIDFSEAAQNEDM